MTLPTSLGAPRRRPVLPSAVGLRLVDGRRVLIALVAIGITLITTSLIEKMIPGSAGVRVTRVVSLVYFAGGIAFLAFRGRAVRVMASDWPFLLLLAVPFVSILWSVKPVDSLIHAVNIGATSLIAIMLATYLSLRRMLFVVAMIFGAFAVMSILLIVLVPAKGLSSDGQLAGSLIGIFGHKNILGQATSLGVIAALFAALSGGWNQLERLALAGCLVVGAGLTAASGSMTATIVLVVSLAAGLIIVFAPRATHYWIGILMIAMFAAPLGFYLAFSTEIGPSILAELGKKQDLSSRIPVWIVTMNYIEQRPLFGWGGGWFWKDNPDVEFVFMHLFRFMPYYSHNGLIETLLSYGLFGVGSVLLALLTYCVRMGRLAGTISRSPEGAVFPSFFVYFFMANFTECAIFIPDSFIWILFVALYCLLRRATLEAPAAGRPRWSMTLGRAGAATARPATGR